MKLPQGTVKLADHALPFNRRVQYFFKLSLLSTCVVVGLHASNYGGHGVEHD